jgi:hypothetical protein
LATKLHEGRFANWVPKMDPIYRFIDYRGGIALFHLPQYQLDLVKHNSIRLDSFAGMQSVYESPNNFEGQSKLQIQFFHLRIN